MPTLIAATNRLTEEIKGFRDDVRKLRFRFWLQVFVTILVIVALAWQWRSNVERNAEQQRARVASCLQFNLQEKAQIAAEIAQSHDLAGRLANGIPDPVRRERELSAYNASHDALIASGHPLRDCTTEGISRYLSKTRATTTTKGKV